MDVLFAEAPPPVPVARNLFNLPIQKPTLQRDGGDSDPLRRRFERIRLPCHNPKPPLREPPKPYQPVSG